MGMFFQKAEKKRIIVSSKLKEKSPQSFFELSSSEQKKIIERATRKANEDQMQLVEKFDKACA